MRDQRLEERISEAFNRMAHLPVVGEVSQTILKVMDLDLLLATVFGKLCEKAALTLQDGELHSFLLMAPIRGGLRIIFTALTWPKELSASRPQAKEQFFKTFSLYAAPEGFAGVLQMDLFLGVPERLELRLAWIPYPALSLRLPPELQATLLPWGNDGPPKELPRPQVAGSDVVALAEVASRLKAVMQERLRMWPEETGHALPYFDQIREECTELALQFNLQARVVDVAHSMPVSKWDDTWLPHNLRNALRFASLPLSLKAELDRVLGVEAGDCFMTAWSLLEKATPEAPAEEDLANLRKAVFRAKLIPFSQIRPEPADVFISYAWSDKTRGARDIYAALILEGHKVWLDEERHPTETKLDEIVRAAMLLAKRIIICVSDEMITRGGYAQREVLLAISSLAHRCIIARLDRSPLPTVLAGIHTIPWYKLGGPEAMLAAVGTPLESPLLAPSVLSYAGPLIDQLLASVKRPPSIARRSLTEAARRRSLDRRAHIFLLVSEGLKFLEEQRYGDIVANRDTVLELLQWADHESRSAGADPTVFGGALRLRSLYFRVHCQLGASDGWELQNRLAYEILEDVLAIDPACFRPALEFGWLIEDCRLAVQDCLDFFSTAQDWFRGWSPEILTSMCHVPRHLTIDVEHRMEARMVLLADRMFALRALEDESVPLLSTPSWGSTWSAIRHDIQAKFTGGTHPISQDYFSELGRQLDSSCISQIAAALTDGVIETWVGQDTREELRFEFTALRIRCILRSHRSLKNKRQSLASVRGTVVADLRGGAPGDLNMLFSIFTVPAKATEEWRYGLHLNCLASTDAESLADFPRILLGPNLVAEMLSEEERGLLLEGPMVYEEQ